MKKGLHPETYRLVAFKDMSNETVFITRSCAETKETLMVDGVEYPVVKVEISNIFSGKGIKSRAMRDFFLQHKVFCLSLQSRITLGSYNG